MLALAVMTSGIGLAVLAPMASAGTATMSEEGRAFSYTVAAGETAIVTVQQTPSGAGVPALTITDTAPGATLTAGQGCVASAGPPAALICNTSMLQRVGVIGGSGSDVIITNVRVQAGIEGGAGDDLLVGGSAGDNIQGGPGVDRMFGGKGADQIKTEGCGDLVDAGPDSDGIDMAGGGGVIDGGDGDDTFSFRVPDCATGNDIRGGAGTDSVVVTGDQPHAPSWPSPGVATFDGVADDGPVDSPSSNLRPDIENFYGGFEDDYIAGTSAANVLSGSYGDDVIDGGTGADRISGGGGEDAIDYSSRTQPVQVNLPGANLESSFNGEAGEADTLFDIEDIYGGSGNDTLAGNGGQNVIDGGPGADFINGGEGPDYVDYSYRVLPVTVDLTNTGPVNGAQGEHDTIAGVEGALGGSGDDRIIGNDLDGVLLGFDGDDYIADEGGEDLIDGGAGSDTIRAIDDFYDIVFCGDDNDSASVDDDDDADVDCEDVSHPSGPAVPVPTGPLADTKIFSAPTGVVGGRGVVNFGTGGPAAMFRCVLDGVQSTCSSPLVLNLKDGKHTLTITAIGTNGVADPTPVSTSWTVDATGPALKLSFPNASCYSTKGVEVRVRATDPLAIDRIGVLVGSKGVTGVKHGGVLRVKLTAKQLKKGPPIHLYAADALNNQSSKIVHIKACKPKPKKKKAKKH